jgi:hypothetical protein
MSLSREFAAFVVDLKCDSAPNWDPFYHLMGNDVLVWNQKLRSVARSTET